MIKTLKTLAIFFSLFFANSIVFAAPNSEVIVNDDGKIGKTITEKSSFDFYDRTKYPKSPISTNSLSYETSIFAKYINSQLKDCFGTLSEQKKPSPNLKDKFSFCPNIDIVDKLRLEFLLKLNYFSKKAHTVILTEDDLYDFNGMVNTLVVPSSGATATFNTGNIFKYDLPYPKADIKLFNPIQKEETDNKNKVYFYILNLILSNISFGVDDLREPINNKLCKEQEQSKDNNKNDNKNDNQTEDNLNCSNTVKFRLNLMDAKKNNSNLPIDSGTDLYSHASINLVKTALYDFNNESFVKEILSSLSISGDNLNNLYKSWIPLNDNEKVNMERYPNIEKENIDVKAVNSKCGGRGIAAVSCTVTRYFGETMFEGFNLIEKNLAIRPNTLENFKPMWTRIRNASNIIFAIIVLISAISYISNYGLNFYQVKKFLPKAIVILIMINISFYIIQVIVDVSNITAVGINNLFSSLSQDIKDDNSTVSTVLMYGISTINIGIIGILAFWAGKGVIIPIIVSGLITILLTVLAIGFRELLIVTLVITSPLALLSLLLPTDKYFKFWKKTFFTTVMLLPIISLIFCSSNYAYLLLMSTNIGILFKVMALNIKFLPLLAVPKLIMMSLKAIPAIGNKLSQMAVSTPENAYNKMNKSKFFQGVNIQNARKNQSIKHKYAIQPITKFLDKFKNKKVRRTSNVIKSLYSTSNFNPEVDKEINNLAKDMSLEEAMNIHSEFIDKITVNEDVKSGPLQINNSKSLLAALDVLSKEGYGSAQNFALVYKAIEDSKELDAIYVNKRAFGHGANLVKKGNILEGELIKNAIKSIGQIAHNDNYITNSVKNNTSGKSNLEKIMESYGMNLSNDEKVKLVRKSVDALNSFENLTFSPKNGFNKENASIQAKGILEEVTTRYASFQTSPKTKQSYSKQIDNIKDSNTREVINKSISNL